MGHHFRKSRTRRSWTCTSPCPASSRSCRPPRRTLHDYVMLVTHASTPGMCRFRSRRRKEFEDSIRRQRQHMGTWLKYAKFEEGQKEFHRARSVFERAIDVDYKYNPVWLKYAEVRMHAISCERAAVVHVCRWLAADGDAPQVHQSCSERVGPRCEAASAHRPVLVQVLLHGGDGGQR